MKVCLVAGAGGFVARTLVPHLIQEGWRVVGAGRAPRPPSWLPASDYSPLDICDGSAVDALVARVRPAGLINLVSVSSADAGELCRTHVNGTCNLLSAVRVHAPACRVVLTGSAAEYGRVAATEMPVTESARCEPMGAYAVTKLAASELALQLARDWSLRVAIVRPFNIIGPGIPSRLLVGALMERVRAAMAGGADGIVRVGNVESYRDFVAVEDVASGMAALLAAPEHSGVFNLCSGRPVQVKEVLQRVLALAPAPLEWRVDAALLRPDDVPVSYGSFARVQAAVGFQPIVPLERSLQDAWNELSKAVI